jgi:hypothetical protein
MSGPAVAVSRVRAASASRIYPRPVIAHHASDLTLTFREVQVLQLKGLPSE